MPRVSVILCSYNQGGYVGSAVESVLAQTFDDWELVVIDNGSTDESQAVLRGYDDPRIRLFLHDANAAITRRFNEGVAAARGDYVSFLYSDDLYVPRKLELQIAAFDGPARDAQVVYGRVQGWNVLTDARWPHPTLRLSGDILEGYLDRLGVDPIDMLTPMVLRECWQRYPFHEDIFAEGEVAYAKLAMTYRFHFLDETLVVMRDTGLNRGKALRKNLEMTLEALDRLGRHVDFPERARPALARVPSRAWARMAWSLARHGDEPAHVRDCVKRALTGPHASGADARLLGALLLSLAPTQVRKHVNDVGFWLRRGRDNARVVDGYGGASR
jgi:glycosyltransferase involved in cell wall biosynthesis